MMYVSVSAFIFLYSFVPPSFSVHNTFPKEIVGECELSIQSHNLSRKSEPCEAQRRWQGSPENPRGLMKKPVLESSCKQYLLIDLGSWKIFRIVCKSIFAKKNIEVIGLQMSFHTWDFCKQNICQLRLVNFRDRSTTHQELDFFAGRIREIAVQMGFSSWIQGLIFRFPFGVAGWVQYATPGFFWQNPRWLDASHRWWASLSPPRCCFKAGFPHLMHWVDGKRNSELFGISSRLVKCLITQYDIYIIIFYLIIYTVYIISFLQSP